mgnify:CR=1 FL=1
MNPIKKSDKLNGVCYDIRGPVLEHAYRLEEEGHRILKLNIGNPAPFGFAAPDEIIQDVKRDFAHALKGIVQLPVGCRLGVYTAYIYYLKLLEKIERTTAVDILEIRIRIPNSQKIALLAQSFVKEKWLGA